MVTVVLCLVSATTRAQEGPPVGLEAPEQPARITSAGFAIQANAVEERLARINNELAIIDVEAEVTRALAEIQSDGRLIAEDLEQIGRRRMMSSELNAMLAELELLDVRVERQIEKLSGYAAELERLSDQNEADIAVWTKARRAARGERVPESVRERTASILEGLRDGQRTLSGKLNDALRLQTRTLDVREAILTARRAVKTALREKVEDVFRRQDPPLWVPREEPEEGAEDREGYGFRFSWPSLARYLAEDPGPLAILFVIVLLVGVSLTRIRVWLVARISERQKEARRWEDSALEAVLHPWAAALLLAFALIRFFYPDRVVDLILLTWVVSLPLWFVVYREMVPRVFQKQLAALGLLGTLHILVAIASGHPDGERALLLLELVLAVGVAVWMLRTLANAGLPKPTHVGLWIGAARAWTASALLVAVVGLCAVVLGYTHLAEEAAVVAVIGSIAATVWMALARVVEAVMVSAIYGGRFDALRMVRANRDKTARVLARVIRLGAFAVFAWSLMDGTAAWRRLGSRIRAVLSADLGLGFSELGVSIGDVLGFFVVLWLSWVFARFVSFVLQEEVFPRMNMKTGVPYALTSFTRYMIIAIGFIAGMAVLGIPLDRVTIVLSALGVGIGFGLQGLVNNVVSGFVLLTERPIRVRDKVEVGGVLGNVSSIGIRASTIRTFDGAEVIVPNGDLISQQVVNWTLSARRQRVTIPVGVAYGSDPNQVLTILRRVASENEGVFRDPAPLALFRGFGDSSLDFELRIFMDPSDVLDVPSAIHIAIHDALAEAEIGIPFPQRDVHLKGMESPNAKGDAER